jgi:DNA primase
MAPDQSAKDEIKRAADIIDLIGQFVQLRKAGRNYVGLCPFHAEKDPSFTVNPERQTFHCFGCKKGGDIFTFWMEYHGSSFPEALRDLADRYQVTISQGFSVSAEKEKTALREALFNINERAAVYFQRALSHTAKGEPARAYLTRRSLKKTIISEFRLGYAPDKWDGLLGVLRRHHVDLDVAAQAGLIIPRQNGGYYDRFRGRIIFPIFDLRKRVVGFGGRVLNDDLPKYLNTPESPVFHKGEYLYGLHASHQAIRESGRAVIVEGYMDCLALRSHGMDAVVATLGTALTPKHVRKLKGYAKEAVIVFDSDEAGKTAALRSLPVFLNEGLSARAVVLPDDHDPDSFVNANGSESFLQLLGQATPLFDFYLEQKLAQGISDVEGKVLILQELLPILSELHTDTQRSLYARRLSQRIGVKEEVVWSELKSHRKYPSGKSAETGLGLRLATAKAEKTVSDLQLLNLLVHYPQTAIRLMDCEWKALLSDPGVVEIVDAFFQKYRQEGQFSAEDVEHDLTSEDARKQLREALLEAPYYSAQTVDQAVAEFEDKANQIRISASIQKAKERGDIEGLNQLLKLKAQRLSTP